MVCLNKKKTFFVFCLYLAFASKLLEAISCAKCKNGDCIYTKGKGLSCKCLEGWVGLHCEFNPFLKCIAKEIECKNGGFCIEEKSQVKCNCNETGYTGPTCEERDHCEVKPCENGGTCVGSQLQPAGYYCICPNDFFGKNCRQHLISATSCNPNPCSQNAVCIENDDSTVECDCMYGYEGPNCVDVNECLNHPCNDNGFCENTDGSFKCLCSLGFDDDQCLELDHQNCGSYLCYNGGICDLNNNIGCECPDGFKGDYCEYLESCDATSCSNNKFCVSCRDNPTLCSKSNEIETDDLYKCVCKEPCAEPTYKSLTSSRQLIIFTSVGCLGFVAIVAFLGVIRVHRLQRLSDHYDCHQEEMKHKEEFHSIENISVESTVRETSFRVPGSNREMLC